MGRIINKIQYDAGSTSLGQMTRDEQKMAKAILQEWGRKESEADDWFIRRTLLPEVKRRMK